MKAAREKQHITDKRSSVNYKPISNQKPWRPEVSGLIHSKFSKKKKKCIN